MKFSRRHFLLTGGLLGGGAYINQRGLRFPRLGFEPTPLVLERNTEHAQISLEGCCFVTPAQGQSKQLVGITLRAFTPQPEIELKLAASSLQFQLNNISPKAELTVTANPKIDVQEQIVGITRFIDISNADTNSIRLSWHIPDQERIRFAVIGDTGGGDELSWCIKRAQQFHAEFLLHLGDFNYSAGEYDSAIEKFYSSPLPIYISIGNHDYNDSGLIYHKFRQHLGPMNTSFVVANTRFVNIDSAASFFPPYSGNRGALIEQLKASDETFSDQVFFTHKPFVDTRQGHHHNMSGMGEIDWVRQAMQELDVEHLLCGHVHRSSEIEVNGVRQWTAGEGLGFEDIRAQKQVATFLMGEASNSNKLRFSWQPLEMPWADHNSPTHLSKLKKQGLDKQLEWYLSWNRQAQS